MTPRRPADTRGRIIAAAEELGCEIGPARVSLEAVAARAGVSKGGLLYHFPSKEDLLRALVQTHVDAMERAMAERAGGCGETTPLTRARAYVRTVREKLEDPRSRPGVFAALVEDPELTAPLRAFRAAVLDGVFARCPDPARAMVVFLACEGMVFGKLTDPEACGRLDRDRVFAELEEMLAG